MCMVSGYILAVNNNPLEDFPFVMKITSYRSTRSLKFNDSFNQHFPWLIFFCKYFVCKNRQGGDELLNSYGKMVQ